MTRRILLLAGLCLVLTAAGPSATHAQPFPLKVTLFITQPSPVLEDWRAHPERIQLTVQNTDTRQYRYRLSGSLVSLDNSISLRTKDEVPIGVKTLPPGMTATLDGRNYALFDPNMVTAEGVDRDRIARTGRLPEGTYRICVTALDAETGLPLSDASAACTIVPIAWAEAPRLVAPLCGRSLSPQEPQLVLFQWTPVVVNVPEGELANIRYELLMVPVPPGVSPENAIGMPGEPPFLRKSNLSSALYTYTAQDPLLSYGVTYAWQVRAYHPQGRVAFRDDGYSPVCSFTALRSSLHCFVLTPVSPVPNMISGWSDRPTFSMRSSERLNPAEITGGLFQIWRMQGENESINAAMARAPQLRREWIGRGADYILVSDNDEGGSDVALPGVYHFDSLGFRAKDGEWYVWRATIRHTTGILYKGPACGSTETSDTASVFGYKTCLALTALEPVGDNIWIYSDSTRPQFAVRSSPRIRAKVEKRTSLEIYEVSGPTKQITPDMISVASFNNGKLAPLFSFDGLRNRSEAATDTIVDVLVVNHQDVTEYNGHTWFPKANQWYAWRMSVLFIPYLNTIIEGGFPCTQYGVTSTVGYCRFKKPSVVPPDICLVLRPQSPKDSSTWTEGPRARFTLACDPPIKQEGIKGGTLKIWEVRPGDDIEAARKRIPIFSRTFSGNDKANVEVLADMDRLSPVDLVCFNGTGKEDDTPRLTANMSYTWNATLEFDAKAIRRDGNACPITSVTSKPGFFTMGEGSSDCPDNCSLPLAGARTPTTKEFKQGDELKIGRFTLKLRTVERRASGLGGTGTIEVPFLRGINIAVEFFDAKVNEEGRIYDGDVNAQLVENAVLTPDLANGLGDALGMSNEQLSTVYNASTTAARMLAALLGQPAKMPIGYDGDFLGRRVTFGIIGMVFRPTAAFMNMVVMVGLPEWGENIGVGLGARKICFTPEKLGGGPISQFYLPADLGYKRKDTWSVKFLAPTPTDSGCFATWDCHGLRDLHMTVKVEFPREWLLPYPVDDGASLVTSTFRYAYRRPLSGRADANWIAAASLDRCEIAGARGFALEVQDIAYDNSVVENVPGMRFPPGYNTDTSVAFMGFYIKRASIRLPEILRRTDASQPPAIAVQNLIISGTGLSASFRGENLLPYPFFNVDGWGGSLDTLAVDVLYTSLHRGALKGRLHMPIFTRPLRYEGMLSEPPPTSKSKDLLYAFIVRPDSALDIDAFGARVSLDRNTNIAFGNDNPTGSFRIVATLTGTIGVTKSVGSVDSIYFPGIRFSNFVLQPGITPWYKIPTFSSASPQKSMSGFPVSISDITMTDKTSGDSTLTGLSFAINVNLVGGTGGVSGSTTLIIWGKMETKDGDKQFSYHGIELAGVSVNLDFGAVKTTASLTLFNRDPIYGNGFRGTAEVTFVKLLTFKSDIMFGRVEFPVYGKQPYFSFMVNITQPQGKPIGASGAGYYGFGGGFWFNMERDSSYKTAGTGLIKPDQLVKAVRLLPTYGGLGLRGLVVLGSYPNPTAINGDLTLEAAMMLHPEDRSFSMSRVSLTGDFYVMCDIAKRSNAKVRGLFDITYDVETKILHGVGAMALTASPLVGGGQAVFHVGSPWYFRLGEPSKPFTASVASWLPKVNAYLMMGDSIPSPPPLPDKIVAIIGQPNRSRDSSLNSGGGVCFGSWISWSTGRKTYGIFYGSLALEGGFDVTMKKQKKCAGVNGWQAQGRLYAYASGECGVYVNIGACLGYPCWSGWYPDWCTCCCWGYKGWFKIFDVTMGMVLELGAPVPLWAKGTVTGKYNILGGLVTGNCNFKFSAGQECRI